jgi:predicted MPP superfamily phosphohydrolase
MAVLFFADLYLWSALRKAIFNYQFWHRYLVTFLFWLPLMMVLIFITGSLFRPIQDWNDVFRTYWIGFILVFYTVKIFPLLFLLIADLWRMVQKVPAMINPQTRRGIAVEKEGISRSKFLQYMGYLTGGMVLGTMLTGMFKWVYEFNVVHEKLRFKRLPKAFDGLRIVQISDLHLGTWKSEKPLQEAVDKILKLKPDIILFTGDLVNFATKEAFRFEKTLAQLKAPLGVFVTLGNHDYGNYVNWPSKAAKQRNMNQLYAFYKRLGWKLLNNRHVKFTRGQQQIALVGVENWGAHPRFPKRGNLKKATAGLEPDSFKLLMSHDPSHWDHVVIPQHFDMDLTLSGHTHGFQFGIEYKNFKWSPAQYMYKEWAGLYTDKPSGRQIYVNRGLGSIGYPGRIGILPEITLLELFHQGSNSSNVDA